MFTWGKEIEYYISIRVRKSGNDCTTSVAPLHELGIAAFGTCIEDYILPRACIEIFIAHAHHFDTLLVVCKICHILYDKCCAKENFQCRRVKKRISGWRTDLLMKIFRVCESLFSKRICMNRKFRVMWDDSKIYRKWIFQKKASIGSAEYFLRCIWRNWKFPARLSQQF